MGIPGDPQRNARPDLHIVVTPHGGVVIKILYVKSDEAVTVGGNRLEFPGDTTTNCSILTTTKCILNSTISTPGDRFITIDIKNFYSNTPMGCYEYMKISLAILPDPMMTLDRKSVIIG